MRRSAFDQSLAVDYRLRFVFNLHANHRLSTSIFLFLVITMINLSHHIWPLHLTLGVSAGDFSRFCHLKSNAVVTHRSKLSIRSQ